MRIITDRKLDFKDVLIRPKRSTLVSRSDVNLERTFTFPISGQTWTGIPIIASNMDTIGTFEVANVLSKKNILTCIHKYYNLNDWIKWAEKHSENVKNVAITTGIKDKDIDKISTILSKIDIPFICLDVANGYSERFIEVVKQVRNKFPNKILITGNVATPEIVEELIINGADIVKIGIGSGSVCTTRYKTGVGYPQLSAIIECADAAHGLNGRVISDGGCTCPGDFSKAFGAGSDFVMAGGILAGHDECAGEFNDIGKGKMFYGMSSKKAITKYNGAMATYRSEEGKTVVIKCRGPIINTINDILGGIRSTCTYVGARKLRELTKRTTFINVGMQLNGVFD